MTKLIVIAGRASGSLKADLDCMHVVCIYMLRTTLWYELFTTYNLQWATRNMSHDLRR